MWSFVIGVLLMASAPMSYDYWGGGWVNGVIAVAVALGGFWLCIREDIGSPKEEESDE